MLERLLERRTGFRRGGESDTDRGGSVLHGYRFSPYVLDSIPWCGTVESSVVSLFQGCTFQESSMLLKPGINGSFMRFRL